MNGKKLRAALLLALALGVIIAAPAAADTALTVGKASAKPIRSFR